MYATARDNELPDHVESAQPRRTTLPFPESIRTAALVAAARHCCVCRRYKGVNVEVHHIVPEAQGGPNTPENAIALCFDCHADAGHYNANHPRGTKFSPNELRAHRDAWFRVVRTNSITSPTEADTFYCRYLICTDDDLFREVTAGNMREIPANTPHLLNNPVLTFQKRLVHSQPSGFRVLQVDVGEYADEAAILSQRPTATRVEVQSPYHPMYRTQRIPDTLEMDALERLDRITLLLREDKVPGEQIAVALSYEEGECSGRPGLHEASYLRPMWSVYLAATNLTDSHVRVKALRGSFDDVPDLHYRPFRPSSGPTDSVNLPALQLPPASTLLVPVLTVLTPFHGIDQEKFPSSGHYLFESYEQTQLLSHGDLHGSEHTLNLIGPAVWPTQLVAEVAGRTLHQELHPLDLSNVYTIRRCWNVGSCPHLFAVTQNGSMRWLHELFARAEDTEQEHIMSVPGEVKTLVISELEDEVTTLSEVRINGTLITSQHCLHKGHWYAFSVAPSDTVTIRGFYSLQAHSLTAQSIQHKNQLVRAFLRGCRSDLAESCELYRESGALWNATAVRAEAY